MALTLRRKKGFPVRNFTSDTVPIIAGHAIFETPRFLLTMGHRMTKCGQEAPGNGAATRPGRAHRAILSIGLADVVVNLAPGRDDKQEKECSATHKFRN